MKPDGSNLARATWRYLADISLALVFDSTVRTAQCCAPFGKVIDSMSQETIQNTDAIDSSILDRFAIEDILTSYARAIDRLDIELLKALYHEDARADHAWFEGTARDFADHVIAFSRDTFVSTMHHVTHTHIALNGDVAAAESYYYAYHRLEGDIHKVAGFFGKSYAERCAKDGTIDDGHDFISGGRYVDSLTKRNGVWRFANRVTTVEWKYFRPATHGDPGSGIERIVAPASRDRNDVAYRVFAAIGR